MLSSSNCFEKANWAAGTASQVLASSRVARGESTGMFRKLAPAHKTNNQLRARALSDRGDIVEAAGTADKDARISQ
jgi:hypothetical protein